MSCRLKGLETTRSKPAAWKRGRSSAPAVPVTAMIGTCQCTELIMGRSFLTTVQTCDEANWQRPALRRVEAPEALKFSASLAPQVSHLRQGPWQCANLARRGVADDEGRAPWITRKANESHTH